MDRAHGAMLGDGNMWMMFLITVALWVNASLAIKSQSNRFPCMYSDKTYAYEDFLRKHVRSDAPTTLDQNQWQAFIRQIGACDRPVQSFLPFLKKGQVDGVCSPSGGKIFYRNLCVSKQEFTFITVYVDNNCIVHQVLQETKYIILACDELQEYCRPVHFEPNKNNIGPEKSNQDCRRPQSSPNQAEFAHSALSFQTLALLAAALAHFIWSA